MDLRLRPLRLADEAAATAAHDELVASDGFMFLFLRQPDEPWADYLDALEQLRLGTDVPPGLVPLTFLIAVVDGEIVGRTSIRHALNDDLARVGGHIGYAVRPGHRRRGHATEILRQSLVVARALAIEPALVTCDEGNLGSATVIERCGGVLENVLDPGDGSPPKRRYWIP